MADLKAEGEKRRRIKYALERDGAKTEQRQDLDNPMSMNFLDLEARHDGDKARWWALYGARKSRPGMAVMDAPSDT